MLCSKCKKRQAVVFVAGFFGDQKTQNTGLCLTCARRLGIPQVEDYIKGMGMNMDDVEDMENNLAELAADGSSGLSEMFKMLGMSFGGVGPDGSKDDAGSDDGIEININLDDDEEADDGDLDSIEALLQRDEEEELAAMEEENEEDEEDEEENEEDDDQSGDNGREERRGPFHIPLGGLFGGFQPGGAVYDDSHGGNSRRGREKKRKLKFLDTYCTNLTERAREGKIDRIIGRDREIERIVQILSRRQKNNPCLIGEPGVGKTAIAEGLALRIVAGNVPQRLAEKQLFLLDLTALVAGTQFRGQFESRIKGLIDEVKAVGNVILFIDEVHNLVGTGDAEGSMNAANILKPALSRGEIQVIGATTFNEYRKHIEKDSALERRFQPVKIEEPSIEGTIKVLLGIKDYYEEHHGVKFSDSLVVKAVHLSERYITDRFLPDKAIDLLDEACACASLRNKAREEKIKLEKDLKINERTQEKIKERSEQRKTAPDYEKLAELKSEALRLQEHIDKLSPEAENCQVTEADLAKVIELWTGVQASRIEESEYLKLSRLADRMKEKIKGQDEAVDLVASAIRRSRVQISPRRRPASFIFVGPTGVGKTELVKVLAAELFDSPETLIRLDMSEFMEKHSVSRLIGSPPGYVGYDEAGQLTEKVRRKPYSVILFDEIEKAHPDVMNILLQVLDEGRINDAQGRTVNFENTVIIMTSNAGSDIHSSSLGFGKSENDIEKDKAIKALSDFLRPEFLARVDEVVCFNNLTEKDFRDIAKLICDEYVGPMGEKGIQLEFSDEAYAWLADHSMGGKSAARDLRNLIRREVEEKLAQLVIETSEQPPAYARVDVENDQITVKLDR